MDRFEEALKSGFPGAEDKVALNLDRRFEIITKVATMLDFGSENRSVGDIKSFFEKILKSDLSSIGQKGAKIGIFVRVDGLGGVDGTSVRSASGHAKVQAGDCEISIPFMLKEDGTFVFDVIQVADKTIAYSRENLARVFKLAKNLKSTASQVQSGFIGTSKNIVTSTDPGFLSGVMEIRDRHMQNAGYDGNYFVSASQVLDESIEKLAQVQAVSVQTMQEVEHLFAKTIAGNMAGEIAKFAAEDLTVEYNSISDLLTQTKDVPWKLVHDMPNGQHIGFPEKDGGEISLTRAMVFPDLTSLASINSHSETAVGWAAEHAKTISSEKVRKASTTLVVTQDQRFILLENREPFYAIETADTWALPTTTPRALRRGNVVVGVNGSFVTYPMEVNSAEPDMLSAYGTGSGDDPTTNTPKILSLYMKDWNVSMLSPVQMIGVPGERLHFVRPEKASSVWGGLLTSLPLDVVRRINASMPYCDAGFFVTDPDATPLVELKGFIRDYLRNPQELDFTDTQGLAKEASSQSVEVVCYDKYRGVYDLTLNYKEQANKVFKASQKKFSKIDKYTAQGILRAVGLTQPEAADVMARANLNNRFKRDLPDDATPENVIGGTVETKAKALAKKVFRNVFSPENLSNVTSSIVGEQIGDLASGSEKAQKILDVLGKFAASSELLSQEFEKVAVERESYACQSAAKAMALCYHTAKAMEKVAKGETLSDEFGKTMRFVSEAVEPHLETLSHNLLAAKVASDGNDSLERISPNLLTAAILQMDRLSKIANAIGGTAHSELICEECGHRVEGNEELINGLCPACLTKDQEASKEIGRDEPIAQNDEDPTSRSRAT